MKKSTTNTSRTTRNKESKTCHIDDWADFRFKISQVSNSAKRYSVFIWLNKKRFELDRISNEFWKFDLNPAGLKPVRRDRIDVILANDIFKYQNLNPKMRKNQFQGWLYKVYDKFHNHLTKKERKCLVKKATEQERLNQLGSYHMILLRQVCVVDVWAQK